MTDILHRRVLCEIDVDRVLADDTEWSEMLHVLVTPEVWDQEDYYPGRIVENGAKNLRYLLETMRERLRQHGT